jgi:hypothetical protein
MTKERAARSGMTVLCWRDVYGARKRARALKLRADLVERLEVALGAR